MSSKSIAWILALVSLSIVCTPRNARAEESSSQSFTGYVAPACTVTTIDSSASIPAGANPSDYVQLRCNMGELAQVFSPGSESISLLGGESQAGEQLLSIAP